VLPNSFERAKNVHGIKNVVEQDVVKLLIQLEIFRVALDEL